MAGYQRHRRATRLHPSEIMTALILCQQSGYQNRRLQRVLYTPYVQTQRRAEFPQLVNYSSFVALIQCVLLSLAVNLQTQLDGCAGISLLDSTALAFCLTPGNVDDRRPVPRLVRRLFGKLFGDGGYIS